MSNAALPSRLETPVMSDSAPGDVEFRCEFEGQNSVETGTAVSVATENSLAVIVFAYF